MHVCTLSFEHVRIDELRMTYRLACVHARCHLSCHSRGKGASVEVLQKSQKCLKYMRTLGTQCGGRGSRLAHSSSSACICGVVLGGGSKVSCAGRWIHALAAAICKLVVITDPLVVRSAVARWR